MRPLAVAAVVLAASLAGCVNDAYYTLGGADDGPPGHDAGHGTGLLPHELPDRSTPGHVKGVVTNHLSEPLAGANVTILSLNRTLLTGADGAYHFTDLPNGRVLLFAKKDGFFGKTQSATIKNGTVVNLDFRLEPIPVVEPYHESVEFAGLIACDGLVKTSGGEDEVHCGAADPNDRRVFESDLSAGAWSVLVEVVWDAGLPTASSLRARVETVGFGSMDAVLANASGRSVLRMEIPKASLDKYYPKGGPIRIVVGPAPSVSGDEAATDAGFAFQQRFDVYVTAFYHEAGPPDFSVLKG